MVITDEIKGIIAGVLLAAAISAVVIGHHIGYRNGRNAVIAADSAALAKRIMADAAVEAKDQAAASAAEKSYEAELSSIRAAATDALGPVQLRIDPRGSAAVSKGPAVARLARRASPGAARIQQVPASDPAVRSGAVAGPDIGPLLSRLALKADSVSAQLRSVQSIKQ